MQLQEYYRTRVHPLMQEAFGYTCVMQIPRLTKVTLNMGVGEAVADRKVLDGAAADLMAISGQRPVFTLARRSIAGFKIRTGYPLGCKVTLRRQRMFDFVQRLVGIALPRSRDFRGLDPKAFDGRGNFSMGISEQIIFTEIDYDTIDQLRGLDVCISTNAQTDEEGLALLKAFNFPFRDTGKTDG